MAESAANFTFTSQNRPSIFEIIASKSLDDTLHPALQKVALFLATNSPRKFSFLGRYYDELFLALNWALQYGYFRNYGATFSENFYGLKRVLINNSELSAKHRHVCLIFAVLLPYFKRKLDDKVALYRLEEADGCLRNGNFKRALIGAQSTFGVLWGFATVYNYVKYLAGQTEAQLPILQLIDVKLVYGEVLSEKGFWATLLKGNFRDLWRLNVFKSLVTSGFEVGAFFLQFLAAWSAQQNFSLTGLPTVHAPMLDAKAPNYLNKCPICLQFWKIPTVLPVSGYVFCFPCILRYLREHQRCPVTNLPAKPLDIIRLYDGGE